MGEPKFTPGPWSVEQPWNGFSAIRGASGELVFALAAGMRDEKRPDDVCEANARLMAAAPDLFGALIDILEYSGGAASALDDEYVVDRARAALLKAGGTKDAG